LGPSFVLAKSLTNNEDEGETNFNCTHGTLLSKRLCLPSNYDQTNPFMNMMVVTTYFGFATFREVDDRKMTITFDVLINLMWRDDRITKSFSEGIESIKIDYKHRIWMPGVYIEHLKSYRQRSSDNQMKLEQLSATNNANIAQFYGHDFDPSHTFVLYRVEAEITLYCKFHFEAYPMDIQVCHFKLGSSDLDGDQQVAFKYVVNESHCLELDENRNIGHALQDFEARTDCYQAQGSKRTWRGFVTGSKDCVAFNITLTRILHPFMMKYYLPSIAIVISSQISFIIPMTAIPARTALLATMFLALVNIFTAQQVWIIKNTYNTCFKAI
jgi:hypothetical protein